MKDFSGEIIYQTTRSGGKGGQNVNKVETAVIGSLNIDGSSLLSDEEKTTIREKLSNRINKEGFLQVKVQTHRNQLANKEEAAERINDLIAAALLRKKPRIATKMGKAAKERRIESKKRLAETKAGRKKFRKDEF